jgi:hypothetical protein
MSMQEEVKRLKVEAQRLTAELAVLSTPVLTPDEVALAELILQRTVLAAIARSQQFRVAKSQSLLTQCMVRTCLQHDAVRSHGVDSLPCAMLE